MNALVKNQQLPPNTRVPYRVALLLKALPRLPLTNEGLPVGYYRVDLLPESQPPTTEEEVQALKNAYSDLNFDNGYPTLSDGRSFWSKLDFEPGFAFGAFEIYLDSLEEGPREISLLASNEEIRRLTGRMYAHSMRTSPENTDELPPIEVVNTMLQEFSTLYLWKSRAKAHDLFKEAAYRHQKLKRQTSTEDTHYLLAVHYLNELKTKVLEQPRFFDDMSPKTAIDFMAKLVMIQRISVGLPANGPLSSKEEAEDISFEMIMKTLQQKASKGNTFDQTGRELTRDTLSQVLEDPRATDMMQELVIRVTKTAHSNQKQEGNRFKGRGRSLEIITSDDLTPQLDIGGAPGANLDDSAEKAVNE